MTDFHRRPAAVSPVREIAIEVDGATLSGLVAEPSGPMPHALVVAVHGAGMHAGYYDAGTAAGLSLLRLGSELGFTVLAPDRPGVGAGAGLPDDQITLFGQARLLAAAIAAFVAENPIGGGVLLVGHSYGLKVVLTLAATCPPTGLLGIDGAGTGIRFSAPHHDRPPSGPAPEVGAPATRDRGPAWGPADLYPAGTFRRGALPLHDMPAIQVGESDRWPADLHSFGSRISVPFRLTYGEHERFWPIDADHVEEFRSMLPSLPSFACEIEPRAGHNLSLGWAARSHHLKVLAFAHECLLQRRTPELG